MRLMAAGEGRRTADKPRERASLPVPLPVPAPAPRALHTADPGRRSSAFLAQLALQYDGRSARNRARAERFEQAFVSYNRASRRSAPAHAHDLKV